MQLIRTLSFLATVLGFVGAVPVTKDESTPPVPSTANGITKLLGPASYDELKAQVEAQGITKRELAKRNIGGLYLCEDHNFQGNCYYGVYQLRGEIFPDNWWAVRITSVGPDEGTYCIFSTTRPCFGRFETKLETFYNPGGNLGSQLNDNVQCFVCYAA